MQTVLKQAIGKRIKQYREKSGYTQEALAEKVGMSPHHLSGIERGVSMPKIEKLVLLINTIGASADQIFVDVIEKTYPTRLSMLSDDISELPFNEQQQIFAVVEAMIENAHKNM